MKNQFKFVFGALFLVILFANVSACASHSRYAPGVDDGIILVIQNSDRYDLHEVENEDRYQLYDYRWGYSYRFSDEYQDAKVVRGSYENNYNYGLNYYDNPYYDDDNFYYQKTPNIKYVYDEPMRSYQKIECYNYPPKDKLLYIKC